MPECRINEAYNRAEKAAKLDLTMPVPMAVRNAPTALMKELGEALLNSPARRHPVHNDYLPIPFRGDKFLKESGDLSDKEWNEQELLRWEQEENGGRPWEGR